MIKRYGKEVSGICYICGRNKKTEIHHIISRGKIETAEIKDLKWLAHGTNFVDLMDDKKLRSKLINSNPRNTVEVCIKCHKMTDSHMKYNQIKKKMKNRNSTPKAKLSGCLLPLGTTPINICRAMMKNGKGRCPNGSIEDQLCNNHFRSSKKRKWPEISEENMANPNDIPNQIIDSKGKRIGNRKSRRSKKRRKNHIVSQNEIIPNLHDEGYVIDDVLAALQMMHTFPNQIDYDDVEDIFGDKTEAWKKRWIPNYIENMDS